MSNTMNSELPILIVGGGIGGLATALALARKGYAVTVLEQGTEFGEIGAGIQLGPNAFQALDRLGEGAALRENAVFIDRLVMMDSLSGEEIVNIPVDEPFRLRFGNPYAMIHRGDIYKVLFDGCRKLPRVIPYSEWLMPPSLYSSHSDSRRRQNRPTSSAAAHNCRASR